MYQQMTPETPGQMYAELVRTRAQERLAHQVAVRNRTSALSRGWRITHRLFASVKITDLTESTATRHA